MSEPKFASIELDISGPDGNAYVIIGVVKTVLEQAGYSEIKIKKVIENMTSSNYEHLLEVASNYITIK